MSWTPMVFKRNSPNRTARRRQSAGTPIGVATLLASAWIAATPAPASAQSAFCRDPNAFCRKMVTADCLQRVGAGALATATVEGDCRAQLDDYRNCVASAASDCAGPEARRADDGRCDADLSRELWALAEDDGDCGGYEAFLEACPDSRRAAFARSRVKRLGCGAPAAAQTTAAATPKKTKATHSPTELDRICLEGASGQPPHACYAHVTGRMEGAWRSFTGNAVGRWGLVGSNCLIYMDFAAIGDALIVSSPTGQVQNFDMAPVIAGMRAEAQKPVYDPANILDLGPNEIRFRDVTGGGAVTLMTQNGFSVFAPNGAPTMELIRRGDALTMQMGAQRFDMTRCAPS